MAGKDDVLKELKEHPNPKNGENDVDPDNTEAQLTIKKSICVYNYCKGKSADARSEASCERRRAELSGIFFKTIMSSIKSAPNLCEYSKTFVVEDVVKGTINIAISKIADRDFDKMGIHWTPTTEHIHWAPTQSGKTAFKVVKIIAYLIMNVPVLLLTKGKAESKELYDKITEYLKGSIFKDRIFSIYDHDDVSKRRKLVKRFNVKNKARVLIIPDTFAQITRATEIVSSSLQYDKREDGFRCAARCALILDESDAVVDRSANNDEKNEKALEQFKEACQPSIVHVTATPLPTIKKALGDDQKPFITTYINTEDYVGAVDFKHFDSLDQKSMKDGFGSTVPKSKDRSQAVEFKAVTESRCERKKLFQDDKIQKKLQFPDVWNLKKPNVPYFNKQCVKLIRREIQKKGAKGMLTLVSSSPFVDVRNNRARGTIFHQASGVQNYFYTYVQQSFIAIVVHADNIFYRFPGHKYGFKCSHCLRDLIEGIDNRYGLEMPIVVFGYYSMKRSRSYRSNKRVPSSMILNLGSGHSNESCRQAGGRPTFRGREELQNNRGTNEVQMLCPKKDFDLITKYDKFILEVIGLYRKKGGNWDDIYSELQTSENNFLTNSKRRTGNNLMGNNKKKQRVPSPRQLDTSDSSSSSDPEDESHTENLQFKNEEEEEKESSTKLGHLDCDQKPREGYNEIEDAGVDGESDDKNMESTDTTIFLSEALQGNCFAPIGEGKSCPRIQEDEDVEEEEGSTKMGHLDCDLKSHEGYNEIEDAGVDGESDDKNMESMDTAILLSETLQGNSIAPIGEGKSCPRIQEDEDVKEEEHESSTKMGHIDCDQKSNEGNNEIDEASIVNENVLLRSSDSVDESGDENVDGNAGWTVESMKLLNLAPAGEGKSFPWIKEEEEEEEDSSTKMGYLDCDVNVRGIAIVKSEQGVMDLISGGQKNSPIDLTRDE